MECKIYVKILMVLKMYLVAVVVEGWEGQQKEELGSLGLFEARFPKDAKNT